MCIYITIHVNLFTWATSLKLPKHSPGTPLSLSLSLSSSSHLPHKPVTSLLRRFKSSPLYFLSLPIISTIAGVWSLPCHRLPNSSLLKLKHQMSITFPNFTHLPSSKLSMLQILNCQFLLTHSLNLSIQALSTLDLNSLPGASLRQWGRSRVCANRLQRLQVCACTFWRVSRQVKKEHSRDVYCIWKRIPISGTAPKWGCLPNWCLHAT